MAFKVFDRVKETSTTTGTGTMTLAGASGAYRTFGSVLANNDTTYYCIAHQAAAEWEVGVGTWQTGGLLARTAGGVLSGSAGAGTLVNFSAGTKDVFITVGCDDLNFIDADGAMAIPRTAGNAIPAAPPTDVLKLFARNRGGRMLLHQMGPSGVDVGFQPAEFGNNIAVWKPSSAALAAANYGTLWTLRAAGTGAAKSHPAITFGASPGTSMKRAEFTTGTTATGASGEQSDLQFHRSNVMTGVGGFFFFARFNLSAFSGTYRLFLGLSALNAVLAGEPSAQANSCGLSKDAADTNYQLLTRDVTTAHKTDTGKAPVANEVLDFMMFCPPHPNGGSITMRLVNALTGAVHVDNVVKSTNLPVAQTPLAMHAVIMSATGTTAKVLGLNRMYCESDI